MEQTRCAMLKAALVCAAALLAAGTAWAQAPEAAEAPAPAVAPAPTAEAPPKDMVDQIKNPVPWFTWGFDERLRQEWIWRPFALSDDVPDNDWIFQRYRSRLWWTLSPVKWFELNTRWTWESRSWFEPDPMEGYDCQDVAWDIFNFKIKEPGDLPVTFTIGRQEIILGSGWLVLEGTPLDDSRTMFFDVGARADVDLKDLKTTVTLAYVQNWVDPEKWLPPFGSKDIPLMEQDEKGVILYASNRSIRDTTLDGYFIYKHNDRVLANGDDGDIYTFGTRVVHDFTKNWRASGEGAIQFGNNNLREMWAGGFLGELSYQFHDPWKNVLRTGYEFLSGDDPDTLTNEQFNPLWARYARWSELYVYTYATETRVAETTNLHRIFFGWQADPTRKLQLQACYHLLFADENTLRANPGFSAGGNYRGQLLTAVAQYKINRFLTAQLLGELFCPGDYYADNRNDPAGYLRGELVFSF